MAARAPRKGAECRQRAVTVLQPAEAPARTKIQFEFFAVATRGPSARAGKKPARAPGRAQAARFSCGPAADGERPGARRTACRSGPRLDATGGAGAWP